MVEDVGNRLIGFRRETEGFKGAVGDLNVAILLLVHLLVFYFITSFILYIYINMPLIGCLIVSMD